jgi:hypothetical protein
MQLLPNEILNHIASYADIDTKMNMYNALRCKPQPVYISDEFRSLFGNRAKSSFSRFMPCCLLVENKRRDSCYVLHWDLWRDRLDDSYDEWYSDFELYCECFG